MINNNMEEIQDLSIDLIKKFEGLSLIPYLCDANKRTIGYGHVILKGEKFIKITTAQAEEILKLDLEYFINEYKYCIKVDLKANQSASLISLMFNIGSDSFKNSTLLKFINSNSELELIKYQFLRWKFVGKLENKGLLNRRLKEWENYCK